MFITNHTKARMEQRGISFGRVKEAFDNGIPYIGQYNTTIKYKGLTLILDGKRVVTVYDKPKNKNKKRKRRR